MSLPSWTTPRTWANGETPTATQFNQFLRDNELILKQSVGLFGLANFTGAPAADGTTPFLMQIGNTTGDTDGSGLLACNLATPFPNNILLAIATNGDYLTNGHIFFATGLKNAGAFNVRGFAGTTQAAHLTVRVDWLALGY